MEWNCKHVVAVALALTRRGEQNKGTVDVWIQMLAEHHENLRALESLEKREHLRYTIDVQLVHAIPEILLAAWIVPIRKNGAFGSPRDYALYNLPVGQHKAVVPVDRTIGRLAQAAGVMAHSGHTLSPTLLANLLELLVKTGRLHWQSLDNPPLRLEACERTQIVWALDEDARQRPRLHGMERAAVLPSVPVWYVDPERGVAGPVELDAVPEIAAFVVSSPPLSGEQAERVHVALHHVFSHARIEAPAARIQIESIDADPVAHVRLYVLPPVRDGSYRKPAQPVMELRFRYGDRLIAPGESERELRSSTGDRVTVWPRRMAFEHDARERIRRLGLSPVSWPYEIGRERAVYYQSYEADTRWMLIVSKHLPELVRDGFTVEIDPEFPYRLLAPHEDGWTADLFDEERPQWFELELGIEVNGERVPLLPVLINALEREGHSLATDPRTIAGRTAPLVGRLDDGRYVALASERVARVLATIGALVVEADGARDGRIAVPVARAASLGDGDELRFRSAHAPSLRSVIETLTGHPQRRLSLPKTFKAELRPYQREGVAWLQALRETGFGGVLADDMGLGKTVQVLAHIAIERAAKRLAAPVLVVAPTSVVPNWRSEAARFLPAAALLELTGADRAERFAAIAGAQIVLTTYALLPRDIEHLAAIEWSMVVLDEAQALKNPKAKAGLAVAKLRARQRLALTGTPIENHLEELWSIFDLAVPGLLADRARFSRLFRTPIEKHDDTLRRNALAARIKPFLLRRTKEDVAQDLPEKTEIVQRIELRGPQRDLYESVRISMHKRVVDEVARRGLARSRIVVLGALLKLRQVCCDPRLLKASGAKGVHESHKLEALLDMLESLVDDGRRILLFSQFTSMLDLMKPELTKHGIPFVELRGDTRDRETPVARFQRREVPLFLISLKAGGTGLNLTAADTVIHYDPWWNPAVERQATDRAHRIGQTEHVFVYKLIAEGTVEERILELQQRKGALAAGLLDDANETFDLDIDDIDSLFS